MHRPPLLALALLFPGALAAQGDQLESRLNYQQGMIVLRNGLATLNVPASFRYLSPEDAERVLVAWGNPPGSRTLGMLVPAALSPFTEVGWAVVIGYDAEGHVEDDDAERIDYDDLLKDMQAATRADNRERREAGYAAVELVGWAAPPRYDRSSHKLYWAKELQFGGQAEHTLNYNIRVLGRRGVLVLNAVASMNQFADIDRQMADVLGFVDFNAGERYADFNPASDEVARYGVAGLVAGGIAAKTGLLKGILAAIVAAKKLVVVAVIAVFAFLKRLFRKRGLQGA